VRYIVGYATRKNDQLKDATIITYADENEKGEKVLRKNERFTLGFVMDPMKRVVVVQFVYERRKKRRRNSVTLTR